jgi:hypothetical protein
MFGTCSGPDPVDQSGDIVISHTMVKFGDGRALRGFHAIIFFAQKRGQQNVVPGHETVNTALSRVIASQFITLMCRSMKCLQRYEQIPVNWAPSGRQINFTVCYSIFRVVCVRVSFLVG